MEWKSKTIYLDKLASSNYKEIQIWQNLFDNVEVDSLFEDFKAWIDRHDNYRNTSFAQTFKELAPYVSV